MLIRIRNLQKKFGDKTPLKFPDLDIPEKGIILLKGRNGAGKSTLIKLIAQFIRPDCGSVEYTDVNFHGNAAFLLDQPILLSNLNFRDNLSFVGNLLKINSSVIEKQIQFYSALFTLPESVYYSEYSLGMKKKAELARTLFHNPKYIFWDEPFASLDTESITLLKDEILDKNKLFFISTHDNILDSAADEILQL